MIIILINISVSATTSTLRRASFSIIVKICSYLIYSSVSQYLTSSYLLILTLITSSSYNNIVTIFSKLLQFVLSNLVFTQLFTHYSLSTHFRILICSLYLTLQNMFNSSFTADFLQFSLSYILAKLSRFCLTVIQFLHNECYFY